MNNIIKRSIAMLGTIVMLTASLSVSEVQNSLGAEAVVSYAASSSQSKPAITSVTTAKTTATIKWSKVSGATKYAVYKYTYTGSDKGWSKLAETNSSTLKYKATGLSAKTNYAFAVRAYVNGAWSDYSDSYVTMTCTAATKISSVSSSHTSILVKVKTVSGVSGYQVAYRKKSSSTWTKKNISLSSVYNKSGLAYLSLTGLSNNTTYYVKVRTYVTDSNGVKHYSSFTSKSAKKTLKNKTLKIVTTKASIDSCQASSLSGSFNKAAGKDVARMINRLRSSKNLGTLKWDETLYKCAKKRAKEIAKAYRNDHTRPDGSSCGTISSTYNGENIARGQTSTIFVYERWYASQCHYENMVSSGFTRVAVACFKYNGNYYWVTAFGY